MSSTNTEYTPATLARIALIQSERGRPPGLTEALRLYSPDWTLRRLIMSGPGSNWKWVDVALDTDVSDLEPIKAGAADLWDVI